MPGNSQKAGFKVNQDGQRRSAYDLLSYAENDLERLSGLWPVLAGIAPRVSEPVAIEAAYGIQFSMPEMTSLHSLGDVRRILETKGVAA